MWLECHVQGALFSPEIFSALIADFCDSPPAKVGRYVSTTKAGSPDYYLILEGVIVPTDRILRSEFDHYRKVCVPLSKLFAHRVSPVCIVILR
jgi:hypothetical protein